MTEQCKHETVMVYTTETVSQHFFRSDDPAQEGAWGNAEAGTVITLDQILCDDCGADLTNDAGIRQEIHLFDEEGAE